MARSNKQSIKKMIKNLKKHNEKFMYFSLNHFEFNKEKRKKFKVKNSSIPYDIFVIELLLEHINASNYLYSGNEQKEGERSVQKSNLLKLEDINFLKKQYIAYLDSKFIDQKEHLENIYALQLKKNKKFYDFKKIYKPIAPPPEGLDISPAQKRDYNDYLLYMDGFDLAYKESVPYNKEMEKMKVEQIEGRKFAALKYMNELFEQANSVLDKESVQENSEFLSDYYQIFRSNVKVDNVLKKTLKGVKIDEEKAAALMNIHTDKFQTLIDEHVTKNGPFEKKLNVDKEKLVKVFKFFI